MAVAKFGIVGTGAIARTHAATLRDEEGAELGPVYDPDRAGAEAFATDFSTQAADSVDSVITESDAVFITAPNRFHAELTLRVLAGGKHVFCEKPFALNVDDARAIVRAVKNAEVVYQLGFNRRFAPAYRMMKEFIDGGLVTPTNFNIKMNRGELQAPPWLGDSSVTGGFLFESTLHLIDMVRYLFGEVKKITAVGSKSLYPCVDDFSMIFQMENGTHGVFSSSAHATWIFPFERVEAYGDHAAMFNDEMDAVSYCLGLELETIRKEFLHLPTEARWGYTVQNRVFVDRVLGRYDGPTDFADHNDGLKNVELMEEVYRQVGLGR